MIIVHVLFSPTPRVTWQRVDGKPNRSKVTTEGHGTEISITNVDFDDGGIYQCTGSNGRGEPQSVNLTLVVHCESNTHTHTHTHIDVHEATLVSL